MLNQLAARKWASVVAIFVASLVTSSAQVTGTYVDAVPADKGGNTVSLPDGEQGGWYEPEEPTAKWPPAGDGRWFWYSGDTGISPDGKAKGKAVEDALFAMYSNYPAPPALQTTIIGLETSASYNVYVHFVAADWVAGKYGIKAGFAGGDTQLFTDVHDDTRNTELPGGGIPTFEALIGNTQAVDGKIVVNIESSGVWVFQDRLNNNQFSNWL